MSRSVSSEALSVFKDTVRVRVDLQPQSPEHIFLQTLNPTSKRQRKSERLQVKRKRDYFDPVLDFIAGFRNVSLQLYSGFAEITLWADMDFLRQCLPAFEVIPRILQELRATPTVKWHLNLCLHNLMAGVHEQLLDWEWHPNYLYVALDPHILSVCDVAEKDGTFKGLKDVLSHPSIQPKVYFRLPDPLPSGRRQCLCLERAEGRTELNKICQYLGLNVDEVLKAPSPPWEDRIALAH